MQWGFAAIIILGGLGGAFFAPPERRLAELAERDIAASGAGEVALSAEHRSLRQLVMRVNLAADALILLTIFFMASQTGADAPRVGQTHA